MIKEQRNKGAGKQRSNEKPIALVAVSQVDEAILTVIGQGLREVY